MSVTVTEIVATYAGNSSTTTPYAITIPRDRDEDLKLLLDGVDSTDFTISVDGLRTDTAQGGAVVLVLYRETPRTQTQPFPSNTTPAAENVRAAVDKLTYMVQELQEQVARAPKPTIGGVFGVSTTLGIDANGNGTSRSVTEERAHLGINESGNLNPFDQDLNTTDPATFTVLTAGAARMATAVLTSSAAVAWDASTNSQPTLILGHNTTLTLSNLTDGQTVSLSGTMSGAGSFTVALAHAGLTVRVMGGALADIATLSATDLFEISIKREGTNLRAWVSTLVVA